MDLHDAAGSGNLERVQVLVRQGIDKDKVDGGGWTSLYWAAWHGHYPVVQYLVEQGADKEIADHGGLTPLIVASCSGRHLDVVRYLLEQGADRDKADNGGWTSLHDAVANGQLEIAMVLMSYGANLNARNNEGLLTIDVARDEEMKQAIRDEPRRRMDHGYKRATEQDRHPDSAAATTASTQQNDGENGEEEGVCLEQEAAITEEEAKILAEINEDSEPSDEEDD